uniref:KIAA1522 ortholog n=1 Tax=Stegastes partitus TaxID=144197 RepID=A0A3B5B4W0_9TELE
MSNRDSLGFGDMLPQDVVDIFSQEKHNKRGQKKRSRSLGRALGWLKGKKRKELGTNGSNPGLGPAFDLAIDGNAAGHQGGHKGGQRAEVKKAGGQKAGRQAHHQGNNHADPKRDDDKKTPAPPLFQENVFIESSRPKYLEDLHTEALEGLKMMQQEETSNGVEYQDNESTISTVTVQTDGENGGFVTDSTIADTTSVASVKSSVSTRSSRSGLTRQGSTFRPLNSGKKSEKAKTRRRHRKTVGSIPQHVQRELGLDRVGWTLTQKLDEEEVYNGDTDCSPTTDGPQQAAESPQGAGANVQAVNIIQPLSKDKVEQLGATHAGHRDDLALLPHLCSDLAGEERRQSLAVPWMTTASGLQQELPSPVITMSPQAAYMSKIIPNAVLPPSIDVVEISRGRSRNSVRTVSKSSLVLSSPASSRASSRASSSRTTSSRPSSRASTITSASHQHFPSVSDNSCWSNSDSSETLVSDTSTISSSSTPRQKRSQDGDASAKEDKVSIHSAISKSSKGTSNGKLLTKVDEVKKDGQFARSLSVMKPKRAPPPPSRSYSLHNKMKRRSRDLAEARVIPGEPSLNTISSAGEENEKNKPQSSPAPSRTVDSPGYNADTSSLDDSTGSVSFSPIKSQLQVLKTEEAKKDAETISQDASQEKQEPLKETKLNKVISPSSGYSSHDGTSPQLSKQHHSASPKQKKGLLAKLQRLFPASSSAGSAPSILTQPEAPANTGEPKPESTDTITASPSVRTLRELFNIPPPPKVHAPPPPPPEVWAHSTRSIELLLGPPAPGKTYAIVKKNPKDRRQQRPSPSASTEGSVKSLVVERKHKNPAVTVESVIGSLHVMETKKVQESVILNAEKENNERLTQNVDVKGSSKDEKVRASDLLNGMLVKAAEKREERLAAVREVAAKKTATQATDEKTLPAISLVRISPSPSPLLAHHPPQPLTKQTTEVVVSPESSWPPPPPPMGQVGLNGPDETDFPLPPPPMFSEEGLVLPVEVPPKSSTLAPVTSVVKTASVKLISGAEPQKPSGSQEIAPPPLNIPPPPPYSAPPPPTTVVLPPTITNVSLPTKEVPPPPPPQVSPVRPKEFSSTVVQDVRPPVKDVSPTLVKVVSPPVIKEVSPPQVVKVSCPPPKEPSAPVVQDVSPLVKDTTPTLVTVVAPSPIEEVSPPQIVEVSPLPPKEPSVSLVQDVPPLVKDTTPTLVTVVPPSPVKEVSPPQVIEVFPPPPEEVSVLSLEAVTPLPPQEDASQSSEEAPPVSILTPPQSIPPPPPLPTQPQSSKQEIDLSQENIPVEPETNLASSNSILTPPQSIPPPPPVEVVNQEQVVASKTDGPATQETLPSPPSEISVAPAPETSPPSEKTQEPAPSPPTNISLPVEDVVSIKDLPSPSSTENESQEQTPAPVVQEEPTPVVSTSLMQMVKLRSGSSSPEPPKAPEQPQAEVTMRKQQPSSQVPTLSASGEAPQKPIRRSLIMTSPASSPPPVITISQPTPPKSLSVVVPPASSSTALSMKKSPPAMTTSPSMNLQEAIRLRTAARSKEGTASRLSLHSPTSPMDLHKSPTSTASFIFSKSNKKVVIETKPVLEDKQTIEKNLEAPTVTKVISEAESLKKGVKVPPPVAKKPKTKGKEVETTESKEQTAGQEAQQESITASDATEKTNGTAGTVEGGGTSST